LADGSTRRTADDVFVEALDLLLTRGCERPASSNPFSPHSGFGRGGSPLLELTNVTLDIGQPGSVRLRNPVRRASHFRALGMAAWNLAGRQDLLSVAFYNSNAKDFSDDASTIRAPWGARLFQTSETSRRSLLAATLDQLVTDPGSTRAVVPIFGAVDVAVRSRDVPCLLDLCFSVDHPSTLHVTAVFRALNAYRVLPYDHALITCLAEAARAHVGLSSVHITYFVRSLHVHVADDHLHQRALKAGASEPESLASSIGGKWRGDVDAARDELCQLEPEVRQRLEQSGPDLAPLATALASGGRTWARQLLGALITAYITEQETPRRC
jgi:hypothetical protein